MSNELVATGEPQFSIARSLSMTFGVLGRNFVPMMTIAVIVTAVQSAVEYVLSGGDVMGGESSGGSFLNILSYGFITAPLTYATFQDLRGTRIGLSDMMSGGFKKIGRVMGAAFAVGVVAVVAVLIAVFLYFASEFLGIAAGIAAAVAVLYVFVAWFVLVPVLVVEDVKFFAGFGRAAALSAGRRWGLLGLRLPPLLPLQRGPSLGSAPLRAPWSAHSSGVARLFQQSRSHPAGAIAGVVVALRSFNLRS